MRVINILSRLTHTPWLRQFPHGVPEWNGWRFLFNATHDEKYDYLVVYDDLMDYVSQINCPPANTIHVATDPPSSVYYHELFLGQFGWVITQDERAQHPKRIFHHGGLTWWAGLKPKDAYYKPAIEPPMTFAELEQLFGEPKSKLMSIITSNETTLQDHHGRIAFAQKLKAHYGEQLDFYGRGFNTMADKLEALRDYRFHIVLENSKCDHYFTEKLTDCMIAGSYPLYCGAPNLQDYFPEHSFAYINRNDFAKSLQVIDNAIKEGYDKKYRAELKKARDLAMHTHNLYPMLIEIITKIEQGAYGKAHEPQLFKGKLVSLFYIDNLNDYFRIKPRFKRFMKREKLKYQFGKKIVQAMQEEICGHARH